MQNLMQQLNSIMPGMRMSDTNMPGVSRSSASSTPSALLKMFRTYIRRWQRLFYDPAYRTIVIDPNVSLTHNSIPLQPNLCDNHCCFYCSVFAVADETLFPVESTVCLYRQIKSVNVVLPGQPTLQFSVVLIDQFWDIDSLKPVPPSRPLTIG